MKTLVGLCSLAVIGGALSLAAGSNAPDRPPGISADRWAPISSTLGVVLVPDPEFKSDTPQVVGAAGGSPIADDNPGSTAARPVVSGDMTALYAPPTAAVLRVIAEGQPVRGYIMVKRGSLWRPLAVVAPTINN